MNTWWESAHSYSYSMLNLTQGLLKAGTVAPNASCPIVSLCSTSVWGIIMLCVWGTTTCCIGLVQRKFCSYMFNCSPVTELWVLRVYIYWEIQLGGTRTLPDPQGSQLSIGWKAVSSIVRAWQSVRVISCLPVIIVHSRTDFSGFVAADLLMSDTGVCFPVSFNMTFTRCVAS